MRAQWGSVQRLIFDQNEPITSTRNRGVNKINYDNIRMSHKVKKYVLWKCKNNPKYVFVFNFISGIKCKALMDLLIELSEENTLTDKEIREEVDTAIVASYDTTSCLLAYIMMLLGTYPETQEKMYKE